MTGRAVDIKVREAVEAVQGEFEEFGERAFARAVQYSLNRVVIEGVNRFRERMPIELRHANQFTLKAVRCELDKTRLSAVSNLDGIVSAAFIQPLQSTWLKYALGETRRPGGDVGIEAYFPNSQQIYLPNQDGLNASFGIRPNGAGNYRASDMRIIGGALAAGYDRNTGYGGRWGAFEIKRGDRDAARLGVGVHARPPRGLAIHGRERLKSKMRDGKASAPDAVHGRRRPPGGRAQGRQHEPAAPAVPHPARRDLQAGAHPVLRGRDAARGVTDRRLPGGGDGLAGHRADSSVRF